MSATLFATNSFPLSTLVSHIQHGQIGLPDLQRPFVWPNKKVRDLFDSMYRGYPVGYLLLWENYAAKATRGIGTDAKQAGPSLLVIDGQQRLTSLYSVFRGVPVKRENFKEERLPIAFRPIDGSFDVADAAIRRDPTWIPDISVVWDESVGLFGVLKDCLERLEKARGQEVEPAERLQIEKAISRLDGLKSYPFTALQLGSEIDEDQVAEVFVRINSKGTPLNQSDFILTLMSVFAEDLRRELEEFCKASRIPAKSGPSPFNYFIEPDPDQMLRVAVAVGFRRARLQFVYSLLRGKDLETRKYSEDQMERQFEKLREAQKRTLDITHWHEFLKCVQRAGFRSAKQITSQNNLLFTYAFYLLGRTEYEVDHRRLRNLIARWLFFSALTGRYTNSPESQMEEDLARLRELETAEEFVDCLEGIMTSSLTNDYWTITLPTELATSAARSPTLFGYYASLCLLEAKGLFSELKISDLLDPALRSKKSSLEKHHLFPKAHLRELGIRSFRDINQIANFALVEWKVNIEISDAAPERYWPGLLEKIPEADRDAIRNWHALPDGWESMEYQDFLKQRRLLMAGVIRDGFEELANESSLLQDSESIAASGDERDDLTAIVLAALPPEQARHFDELLDEPLGDVDAIRKDVETYANNLEVLQQYEEFLDIDTARRVSERLGVLLDELRHHPDPSRLRLVQTAALYFILDDDAESDIHSPIGFDDDEHVVAAVEGALRVEVSSAA